MTRDRVSAWEDEGGARLSDARWEQSEDRNERRSAGSNGASQADRQRRITGTVVLLILMVATAVACARL